MLRLLVTMLWLPAAVTPADDDFAAPAVVDGGVAQAPEAELQRGDVLLRLGLYAEAARAFHRVIAVQPDHLRAHERLRRAIIEAHRTDLLADLTVRLVDLHLAAGDRDTANLRLDELIALEPTHSQRARLEQVLGRNAVAKTTDPIHLGARLRSLLGIFVLLALAMLMSTDKRRIPLRLVGWGIGLQVLFAFIVLWTPPGRWLFDGTRLFIDRIIAFTDAGAGFLFGNLYNGLTADAAHGPMQVIDGTSGDYLRIGMVFAFHILPTIVFFGALMSVLYHLGAVQKVVHGIAWAMRRSMKTSGAESLAAAINIFVGQTEAPLVVKPYVTGMTRSELMAVMVGGFANIAGSVLAAYARFGIDPGHMLAASVMSAPASLLIAKMILPETEVSQTAGGMVHDPERATANLIDAAASGASDGLQLAMNVGAMLVAFIALVAMIDWGLGFVGGWLSLPHLSLKTIFGTLFYPLAWCMGADTQDLTNVGNLLGIKIALNEFVAYIELAHLKAQMTERSVTIATYALCGFANFASIGIQIGGIAAIAPTRRSDLARIGMKAMFGGAIATGITACIAGVLL